MKAFGSSRFCRKNSNGFLGFAKGDQKSLPFLTRRFFSQGSVGKAGKELEWKNSVGNPATRKIATLETGGGGLGWCPPVLGHPAKQQKWARPDERVWLARRELKTRPPLCPKTKAYSNPSPPLDAPHEMRDQFQK